MSNIKENVKYRLLCLETATYLSISNIDNVSIVGNQYTDGRGQEWIFELAGDTGLYTIKSADEGQYIAIPRDEVVSGQQLMGNSAPYIWRALAVDHMKPAVRFSPISTADLFVDLYEDLPADNTKIQLWGKSGNNQIWILEEVRE